MVAWLITPEIDLNGSNNEVLTFDTKDAYNNGDALEVFISNDFSGNNVGSATWNKLDVQIAKGSNSGYASSFTDPSCLQYPFRAPAPCRTVYFIVRSRYAGADRWQWS